MEEGQKILQARKKQRLKGKGWKKCKLFTKSKTDFSNKFVMHVTCPNNACAFAGACVWSPKRNLNK